MTSWIKTKFNPKKHTIYIPINMDKYRGKERFCICRSSWEKKMAELLDHNPNVVEWSSESMYISYFNPLLNRNAHYYPDFIVKTKSGQTIIIEVKPEKEVASVYRPTSSINKKSNKTKLYEQKTMLVNKAKWQAASTYCANHGYVFKIITEKILFK